MSSQKKRAYSSKIREGHATLTRNRILDAAKRLFQANGLEFVTIENIANEAQVSSPTIYALFQSKRGILRAIMDEALPSEQFEVLVKAVNQEKCAKKRLLIAAKIARQMYDAEKEQMDIFRGVSILSPELKEFEIEREQRRYQRQEPTMRENAENQQLAKNLPLTKARDILWAFTGRDMYRMLVVERGWSSDEYEKWLGEILVETLIEKSYEQP